MTFVPLKTKKKRAGRSDERSHAAFFSIRRYTSSTGFTLDTYAHVTTSAQKEAAKTMGNVLAVE